MLGDRRHLPPIQTPKHIRHQQRPDRHHQARGRGHQRLAQTRTDARAIGAARGADAVPAEGRKGSHQAQHRAQQAQEGRNANDRVESRTKPLELRQLGLGGAVKG